jgi:hypothetical protein
MVEKVEKARGPKPPRRGLRALAALVALAILVAIVFTRAPRSRRVPEPVAERDTASRPEARPGPGPLAVGPAPAAPPGGGASTPMDPHDMLERPPPLPSARFPYPPGSQPVSEGSDPATQSKESDPVDAEKGITCLFGPRVAIVHPPDPMVIDLQVQNRLGAPMPITNAVARFRTERADPVKGPWFTAPLVDDGTGKDLAPGDYHYTATYLPSPTEQAALLHDGIHVFVEVAFEAPQSLGPRKYVTVMEYSREPDAVVNGNYNDALQNGSLVINVGVTAKVAAPYRVIGTLYSGESALAFASKEIPLAVGDGFVPLLFFGKILHDRALDGPYELRYVQLQEHVGGDAIPGDTIDPAYTTKFYRASSFSDASYAEPAPSFEAVDQNSPSQQDKPPPLYTEADRAARAGGVMPIKPDPVGVTHPIPTGTK